MKLSHAWQRPAALNQPHHEAGQMTAPEHMP